MITIHKGLKKLKLYSSFLGKELHLFRKYSKKKRRLNMGGQFCERYIYLLFQRRRLRKREAKKMDRGAVQVNLLQIPNKHNKVIK